MQNWQILYFVCTNFCRNYPFPFLKQSSHLQVPDDKKGPLRFPSDHVMFRRLSDVLLNSITSAMHGMWVPMAEEAINVIYNLGEHPEKICDHLIKNLMEKIFGRDENLGGSDASDNDKGKAVNCVRIEKFLFHLCNITTSTVSTFLQQMMEHHPRCRVPVTY